MNRTTEKELRIALKEYEQALHAAQFRGLRVVQLMPPGELMFNEDPNSPQPDPYEVAHEMAFVIRQHRRIVQEWVSMLPYAPL